MNHEKKHVFFRRVSTTGQSLTMQQSADLKYRDKLLRHQVLLIEESAISANKKSTDERPEMQRLISLIKNNRVDTLYAFDRTRLFRDTFEGMEFTDLCLKHQVKIVYTSEGNGHIQSTQDIFLESFLGMFSDMEGKNIARRTHEANKRYPPKKLGYTKIKEKKSYIPDEKKETILKSYFAEVNEITDMEHLCTILNRYQKELKCSAERLISIAQDPFYAGFDLENGENRLPHVTPYMTLQRHKKLQEEKGHLFTTYKKRLEKQKSQDTFAPICGLCKKPMLYRISVIENKSNYSCSRKHERVLMQFDDLSRIIQQLLQETIKNLNFKKLLYDSTLFFRNYKKKLVMEAKAIDHQIKKYMENLILSTNGYSPHWKDDLAYKKLKRSKEERELLLKGLDEANEYMANQKNMREKLETLLTDRLKENSPWLFSLFVRNIVIYPNSLDVEVSNFDYLTDLQKEFVYEVGEVS
ncbi:recombinase family protein [Fictibacillus fluitans]|uniref:Recombinase family protein n=1 Tax=Fictibacillus fluitans TaxID=3058422 RepID=A0ABT8I040_9BACL|nr:recombinase family protein [Fictibacillus sp. NE201]MDN4526398.1 recombinase family protein [Fictibacillus sp. NE201]